MEKINDQELSELVSKIDEFMESSGESMTLLFDGQKAQIRPGCRSCGAAGAGDIKSKPEAKGKRQKRKG